MSRKLPRAYCSSPSESPPSIQKSSIGSVPIEDGTFSASSGAIWRPWSRSATARPRGEEPEVELGFPDPAVAIAGEWNREWGGEDGFCFLWAGFRGTRWNYRSFSETSVIFLRIWTVKWFHQPWSSWWTVGMAVWPTNYFILMNGYSQRCQAQIAYSSPPQCQIMFFIRTIFEIAYTSLKVAFVLNSYIYI